MAALASTVRECRSTAHKKAVGPRPPGTDFNIPANDAANGVTPMQMTRNRYFLIGMLLILLGVQFRMVESFVLNAPTTKALARMTKNTPVADNNFLSTVLLEVYPSPTKRVAPPRWLGLAMIAVGAVVALHALALPKNQS